MRLLSNCSAKTLISWLLRRHTKLSKHAKIHNVKSNKPGAKRRNIMEVQIMITMKNVLAAANEQVARLMSEGYMISFMNASFGYKFRVDLENGNKFVRVKVEEDYSIGSADTLVLSVIEINEADGHEYKDAVVFYSKTWYIVERLRKSIGRWLNDYNLVESQEESDTITKKRNARWVAKNVDRSIRELTPTASLIRALKNRKGFSNATRNNILVTRVNGGYEIKLKARDGHVSRTEVIKFPKH